jgi:hypothetical protein
VDSPAEVKEHGKAMGQNHRHPPMKQESHERILMRLVTIYDQKSTTSTTPKQYECSFNGSDHGCRNTATVRTGARVNVKLGEYRAIYLSELGDLGRLRSLAIYLTALFYRWPQVPSVQFSTRDCSKEQQSQPMTRVSRRNRRFRTSRADGGVSRLDAQTSLCILLRPPAVVSHLLCHAH